MAGVGSRITPLDQAVNLNPDVVSDSIHMDQDLSVFFGLLKGENNLPAGAVLFDTASNSLKVTAAPVGAPPTDPDLRLDVEGTGEVTFFTAATQKAVITNGGNFGVGVTIPGSSITTNASIGLGAIGLTSGTTTLTDSHFFLRCDATAGVVNLRLPSLAVASTRGRLYCATKSDASANVVNLIATPGQTINGAASQVLTVQYQTIMIIGGASLVDWSVI